MRLARNQMIIRWGTRMVSGTFDTGPPCIQCSSSLGCDVSATYTIAGLLWVFNVATNRSYTFRCANCGKHFDIDKAWRVS
jgi:predicted nucleic-acid-binding Zn-ribbon protein